MPRKSEFVELATEQMEPFGSVTTRAMFGGFGVYRQGLIFAIIVGDRLYFKVDSTTQSEFDAQGLSPFTYTTRGKSVTMRYYEAPPEVFEEPEAMCLWAERAYGAALTARNAKQPRVSPPRRKKIRSG